jgi:hypothetical protein
MRALTPLSVILCAGLLASCAGTPKPLTINVPPSTTRETANQLGTRVAQRINAAARRNA